MASRRTLCNRAFLIMATLLSPLSAFQSHPILMNRYRSSSVLCMGSSNADFEYQEMRVQLNAMKRDQVPSRDLPLEKRQELESYVSQVATQRPSSVALQDIGHVLSGTKWRLGFSTEAATLGDLPRDADVYLDFLDESKVDYILQFSKKTFGLNRLVAKSSYTVDVSAVPVSSDLLCSQTNSISSDRTTVGTSESRTSNVCL